MNYGTSKTKPRKRPPPRVTAIIGFATSHLIVFASDGQATSVSGGVPYAKCYGEQKVFPFRVGDNQAMLGFSGSIDLANMLKELLDDRMTDERKDILIADEPRGVVDEVEKLVRKVRDKVREGFQASQYSEDPKIRVELLQEHFSSMDATFLLGYYYKDEPRIYTIDMVSASAIRIQRSYVARGSGAGIAEMILEGHNFAEMPNDTWIGLAAYTIQMCKNFDPYCGGRTQLGVLMQGNELSPAFLFPAHVMKRYEDSADEVHKASNAKMLKDISEKYRDLAVRDGGPWGLDGKPIQRDTPQST